MMTHRERVLTALNHEEPDRCPMEVAFTPEFRARLRTEERILDFERRSGLSDDDSFFFERALGQDVLLVLVGWAGSYYQDDKDYTDEWGVGWRIANYATRFGDGFYTEIAGHPLAEDGLGHKFSPGQY